LKPNQKLSSAIVAVLSVHAAAAYAQQQAATPQAAGASLMDVVVTAQRRQESIQNVPITVQALTAETLTQLNATTLDDYLKYLPNVARVTNGPGQSNIYIRGVASGSGGTEGSGAIGNFPNVAVYLDDQSEALPGRNLDIYAADLERIEVLEGPQGTLFGGGAEAGVLRYITNKPKLNVTEGSFDAGYGTTAGGDPNNNITVMLNIPLIADTLAVRGVFYNDRRGGYINNVPSEFNRMGTDLGIAERMGGVVPANSEVINNYQMAANAINPLTYTGFRVSAFWKINDNWNALLSQAYQNIDAEGVFYENPTGSEGNALPPLSVTLFNPSFVKDRFENTALTINGQIGDLKVIYSGAYLVRNIEQIQDYTNYAKGVWATYYQCNGYSTGYDPPTKCYSPSATWHDTDRQTHQSHELRLTTPDDKRLRGTAGVYWEDFEIYDQMDYWYKSVPTCSPTFNTECFLPIEPWPGTPANNPNVRNPADAFFDDVQRGYKQTAAFASIDFDLIPKALTLTLGTRYFKYNEQERGGDVGSFYCKIYAGKVATNFGPCSVTNYNGFGPGGPYGTNLDNQVPNSASPSGFKSRANLSWKVTDDALLYYTWSQGFRVGGFNRGTSAVANDAHEIPQFITPALWSPDTLTNNEVGWKTEWFNHRVLFNAAVYQEDWTNVQTGIDDPTILGNLAHYFNGPSYRIRGFEPTIIARVTDGLTVQAAASWNSTNQTNSPYLINNNPKSPTYGQPITSIPNPYGPLGSPLPNSPAFQGNVRVRYDWSFDTYSAFWQLTGTHTDHSYGSTGYTTNAYDNPGYSTYDGSVGIAKGPWSVTAYGQNLTNVLTAGSLNDGQFIETAVPQRPRVLGIKASYKFSDK